MTNDIESYVYGADCVPKFSLANIAELFAMIKAVDDFYINPIQMIRILRGAQDDGTIGLLETLNQTMEEARLCCKLDNHCKLKLSGKVFYIIESDYEATDLHPRIFKVSNEFIDDHFLVLKMMTKDHGSAAYMNAFDKMKYH